MTTRPKRQRGRIDQSRRTPTPSLALRAGIPHSDLGFITFWQRWNHPHPRPELIAEPEARKPLSSSAMSETPSAAEQSVPTAESSAGFFPLDDVARETNCVVIDWMEPIDPTGAVPICIILLGCSWLFAFSGWEDYVDAVHTPWLRVVLPCVLLLLAASFIPRDVSPRDPGFITFWQRWNHPHPRPELLGESPTT